MPKEKINILFLENINDSAVRIFVNNGYVNIKKLSCALGETELIRELKDVHVLGIRSKTQITSKVLRAATKLQAIGCFCIGVNQVDLKAATHCGVVVFNAPYSNTRSVAELVIGAAIMLIRRVIDKNNAAHKGIWLKEATGSYELRGKTLGIVGYGNIGSQLSVLAEALGMKVLYYDEETKLPLGNAVACHSLKELVSKSGIITLHIPDTQSTKNMINTNIFHFFKKGSILINYARGEIVDIDALRTALEDGTLSGAAVDVFPLEPENNKERFETPLQGMDNVLLTPHIGGSTQEAQQNIGEDISSKLLLFLEKGITIGSHTVPAINLPPVEGAHRILHIHKNVPGVLSAINTELSKHNINILGQYLKTNDDIGYVVLDIDLALSEKALQLLQLMKEAIKVRMLY